MTDSPTSSAKEKTEEKGETWSVRKAKINEILLRFDAAIKLQKEKEDADKENDRNDAASST